jgi:hypothetical protein
MDRMVGIFIAKKARIRHKAFQFEKLLSNLAIYNMSTCTNTNKGELLRERGSGDNFRSLVDLAVGRFDIQRLIL